MKMNAKHHLKAIVIKQFVLKKLKKVFSTKKMRTPNMNNKRLFLRLTFS